jgi:hypothetical protein
VKGYSGRSVTPRRESIVYRCNCGERFSAEVWRAISAEDAALRTRLIEGELNRVRCPRCDTPADVQVSVLYHDPEGRRLVCVAPPSERHRELAVYSELFAQLAADVVPAPDYVLDAALVFGAAELTALLAEPVRTEASEWPEPVVTPNDAITAPVPALPSAKVVAATPAVATTLGTAATQPELETSPVPRAPTREDKVDEPTRDRSEVTQPRATVTVPDPRTAVIERWIAARETDTALFVDDRVVVCAALPAGTLEQFVTRDEKKTQVTLRPQLHRMTTFPLVVLTFVAGADGERIDEGHVFHVPLDLARAAHRVSLDALQRRCALELELFDTEYLPVVSLSIVLPLEEHVRHLVSEAKSALERVPSGTRSYERARTAFLSGSYDRLGRTVIDLPTLDEVGRAGPAATRAALHAVARWSEPAAEGYLLEIRSYPLPVWRRLAATVVRRAVEMGLFVPRSLAERVARRARPPSQAGSGPELADLDAVLDLPQWPELIEIEVRRFAELSARLRPSDLSAADEAANWEQLLREAEAQGIAVEDAIRRLAEAAFERIGGQPSKRARAGAKGPSGVSAAPMRGMPQASSKPKMPSVQTRDTGELLTLLDDRELRLEAAIELASRHEVATLPVLFAVLRRMSRIESNALLPRIASIGAPAERWLIDGLRSKKSFMRQGCALALGRLQTPMAIDALVRLLFAEPTEIWTEIARAIGDVGVGAVMPLAARVREVEGEERERIVQALAHVVSRDAALPGSRAAVEALATGRDALVATAARRALVLAPEVHNAHEAVRSERREQTLVRAFTRRFYDAFDNGDTGEHDIELDPAELEALDDLDELDEDLLEDMEDPSVVSAMPQP